MYKKLKSVNTTAFVSVFVLGLSVAAQNGSTPAKNTTEMQWSEAPSLSLAISGHFAGESHGTLITAGGANFPVPLFEGGAKEWVAAVHVLPSQARFWMPVEPLARPVAYGTSVSDGEGVICLGGGDAQVHTKEVFRLDWTGKALVKRALPPLPKTCAFMGAARLGRTVYVVGGQETPSSTTAGNTLWALNFQENALFSVRIRQFA